MTFTRYDDGLTLSKAHGELTELLTEINTWGPNTPAAGWSFSARANFSGAGIDFSYNRATRRDITPESQALIVEAIKALEYLTRRDYLRASSDEWVIGTQAGMVLLATTNTVAASSTEILLGARSAAILAR